MHIGTLHVQLVADDIEVRAPLQHLDPRLAESLGLALAPSINLKNSIG